MSPATRLSSAWTAAGGVRRARARRSADRAMITRAETDDTGASSGIEAVTHPPQRRQYLALRRMLFDLGTHATDVFGDGRRVLKAGAPHVLEQLLPAENLARMVG